MRGRPEVRQESAPTDRGVLGEAREAPGLITVSWLPCLCASQRRGAGHLRVSCRAPDCPSVWYRPPHRPSAEITSRLG
jgi:hypothetical protein